MEIRKIIRVGPFVYRISLVETPLVGNHLVDGSHDHEELVIEVSTRPASQRQAQVIWHEVIHAIFDAAGFEPKNEEQIVEIVSHGICQVLRDNPWMGKI